MHTTVVMASAKIDNTPETSLSAIIATTPINGLKSKASVIASIVARAPWGLWQVSSTTVGERRTTSSRAGDPHLLEALGDHVGRQRPPPRNASTAATASAAFWAMCAAEQRKHEITERSLGSLQAKHLTAHGQQTVDQPELDALTSHLRTDLGAAGQQHLRCRRAAEQRAPPCSRP